MDSSSELRSRLASAGQDHLLRFWDQLDEQQKQHLARQIAEIDFEVVQRLYANRGKGLDWGELAARAQSPPAVRLGEDGKPEDAARAQREGEALLRAGKLGMILVAGGQGSRLGFPHPKGMFPLGPVSRRTLFQILLEPLLAIEKRFGAPIPLYIMTSPATHEETLAYLAEQNHLGLAADQVRVFCQGVMPAVDMSTGKLLLAEPESLFLAPDGHGGMLAALSKSGCLADAQKRGVEHFFYCQVDNPLVRVCDPVLVGHHVLAGSQLTTMAVAKTDPLQPVGNVVSIDEKVRIIEYSDLPKPDANRRAEDGSLQLWAGNVAVHVFCAKFLEQMVEQSDALPFHRARKPTPHINDRGESVRPKQANAFKFERFIFDLLPWAETALVVECSEADSFAPVKNGPDAESDTAATAQAAMSALHKKWLRRAGAAVDDDSTIEISPLFALDEQELALRIEPGLHVDKDRFFV